MHVYAHIQDNIWYKQFFGVPSPGLKWQENKTYKLKSLLFCWENVDLLVGSNPLPGSYINFVDLTDLPQICMGDKISERCEW